MERLSTLCLLVLFLAIVSTPGSTGLDLGVSFDPFEDLLHVKCTCDGKMRGARMSLMMKIGKVGQKQQLASSNLVTGITVTSMNASKTITAEGHIDKKTKKSSLNVTIDGPGAEDAGMYRCQLLYIDQQYKVQEDKVLFNVTMETIGSKKMPSPGSNETDQDGSNKTDTAPDTPTMVKYLLKQLKELKATVSGQKETIGELKDTVKVKAKDENFTDYVTNVTDTISKLETKQETLAAAQNKTVMETIAKLDTKHEKLAAAQNKTIADLNTQTDNLKDSMKANTDFMAILNKTVEANTNSSQRYVRALADLNVTMRDQLQDLKTQATYQCAFSASLLSTDTFQKMAPLRFSEVVLNLGEAYSNVTGLFTAPVDGVYVFHLIVGTENIDGYAYIYLRVNQRGVSSLYAYDKETQDQSAVSAVVDLRAGETMHPWLLDYSGGLLASGFSTFSGYLLQASDVESGSP